MERHSSTPRHTLRKLRTRLGSERLGDERLTPRRLGSRLLPLLVGICIAGTLAGSTPASASQYDDADYVGWVANELRAEVGVAPLAVDSYLTSLAQGWADELAAGGYLAHNPGLAGAMGDWWAWGENVGYGGTAGEVADALVDSPWHYANMVDPAFWAIGVAVVYGGDGLVYVVEVFGG